MEEKMAPQYTNSFKAVNRVLATVAGGFATVGRELAEPYKVMRTAIAMTEKRFERENASRGRQVLDAFAAVGANVGGYALATAISPILATISLSARGLRHYYRVTSNPREPS
jgi:hypothetical protein